MVKNPAALERFELEWIRSRPPDYRRNFATVDALYEEARHLGTLRRDPLEGIETIVRVAKAVNSV